jgi:hypothetical protein
MINFENIKLTFSASNLLNMIGYCSSDGAVWQTSNEDEINVSAYLIDSGLIKRLEGEERDSSNGGYNFVLTDHDKEFIRYSKAKNDGWVGGIKMDYEL